jgi:aryl-alcohol dehydrogenase-like predicted oxidoreductase
MDKVILGKTGLAVSPIAFGTWQLGGDWGATDEAAATRALERSRELGVNFYDTAEGYGWGESERILGRALRADLASRRNEIVIATKGGLNYSTGELRRDSSPEWLRRGVERSLEALGVDHIDIYQVHWPDRDVSFGETAEVLQALVEEGLIRHVGVSNFSAEEMREFSQTRPVETLQPSLSLFRREIEDEILPYCAQENIGVLVYGPLAHGLLTGAMSADMTFATGDWRGAHAEFRGSDFRRNLEVADRLRVFAEETFDCTLAQLAVAWVLSRPGVHSAIVGTRQAKHLEDAVAATEIELSDTDLERIDEIAGDATPLVGVTPESF